MPDMNDMTNRILGDVLTSTTLERALYPDNTMGLPDDLGDEFPNLTQNYRAKPAMLTDEDRYALRELERDFMRKSWGVDDAWLDQNAPSLDRPVNLLDAMRERGLR